MASNKGRTIHSQAREKIRKVIAFCDKEAEKKETLIPLSQATKRASEMTGVSIATVKRLRKEAKKLHAEDSKLSSPGKQRPRAMHTIVQVDDFDKCVIRNIINDFYIQKKIVPSISKLLPIVKEQIHFPWGSEALRRIIHKMGFRWRKCTNMRSVLMEKPQIVSWRFNFLRNMKKYRNMKKNIVYLDETWVDTNITFQKCWQGENVIGAKSSVNSGNRLIVVHAGETNGFIPNSLLAYKAGSSKGDYHGQMNFENFEKWLLERLLPNIPPNSVVCLDNAPYHTKKTADIPSKYSTKIAMIKWLEEKGLKFDSKMRKPELHKIISENAPPSPIYRVDKIIEAHGHVIIRLPPYHCDLNPIELAWADLKRYIRERNIQANFTIPKLIELTEEGVKNISEKNWQKYCEHVIKLEENYWEKDGIMEEVIDELIINIDDYDTDETESEESSFEEEETS